MPYAPICALEFFYASFVSAHAAARNSNNTYRDTTQQFDAHVSETVFLRRRHRVSCREGPLISQPGTTCLTLETMQRFSGPE